MHPIAKYVSFHRLSQNLGHIEWRMTILKEMKALKKNNTWEIVELLRDKRTVGCKWVFMVKYQIDGSIDRYKARRARLVAKRFTQTYKIDYRKTFAPIAKVNLIRVLRSLELVDAST